jgi:hypothetical protein
MNEEQPKIEIFEPFGAAFEMMKKILFQPFDFAKWCVLGFAAFLSGSWGSNFRFHIPGKGDWNFRSTSFSSTGASESMPSWLLPLIIALVTIGLIVGLVVMWVVSRGRFIFTDCVVKNRAAIAAPWREYRREGNSFFLFSLAVTFLSILLAAATIFLIVLPLGLFSDWKWTGGVGATAVITLVFVGLVWLAFGIFFALVSQFMVPIMYRRRCLAREAFVDGAKLVFSRPGPIVLFVLFGMVLGLALVVISTIATCVTCCIAGLPYVSSVVLLPAFVWLLAFKLLFLRQFGPEYDVWATADLPPLASPPAPPSTPPPIG